MTSAETKAAHLDPTDQPPSYEPATSSSAPPRPEDTTISSIPLSFPDVSATATEVRTYLRSFLWHNATKYDLSRDDVIRVAGAWRYGSGQELRSYDRPTWEGLFGAELGSVLLKHVQEEVVNEMRYKSNRNYRPNMIFIVISVTMISIILFLVSLADTEDSTEAARVIGATFGVPFIGMFVIAVGNLLWKRLQLRRFAAKANGDYLRLDGEDDAVELGRVENV